MTDITLKGAGTIKVGKILCLLRSYQAHAEEMGNTPSIQPDFFIKPSTAIIFDNDNIILPDASEEVHHEVELAVLIGKPGKNITEAGAMDHVLGYGILIDVTARDIQAGAKKAGKPWAIAKGFDTFAPISEFIPKEQVPDVHNLDIWLKVNGEVRQSSNTSKLLFTIPEIINFISSKMALEPGDIIATGTPEGVSEIKAGDIIEAGIYGVGVLRVGVE
ncbi:MAG: fumarylacetoacetate hydrolase family protein [Thermoplasmata archaeon]|nr:fumarylacetoacetate hydrolase family protein [Thermoplasmata archaeon]